jgi:HlyD family secretion protein
VAVSEGSPSSPPPSPGLFRQQALEQLDAAGRLDTLMKVTSPRLWIGLGVLVAAIAAAAVWSVLGAAQVTVTLNGVLNTPDGLVVLNAPATGTITSLDNAPDLELQPGQTFGEVLTSDGALMPLRAITGGVVTDWVVNLGAYVRTGAPIASMFPGGGDLLALMYTSETTARMVAPGMRVDVAPDRGSTALYGSIIGRVLNVESSSTISAQRLTLLEGGNQQAQSAQGKGPFTEVDVQLQADPYSDSGYRWTSGSGPPYSLEPGTTLVGTVIISRQSPISVIFGG